MSDYFSLQFLEKIEGLDSDTPTINGDKELALPTPMKTLLKFGAQGSQLENGSMFKMVLMHWLNL